MVTTADPELAARIKMYALHGMSRDAWKRFSDEGYKHYQVAGPRLQVQHDRPAGGSGHPPARPHRGQRGPARGDLGALRRGVRGAAARAPRPGGARHRARPAPLHHPDRRASRERRDAALDELVRLNIGTGVHYTALHLHPYYRETFGHGPGDFPNAEHIGDRTLSLPLSPSSQRPRRGRRHRGGATGGHPMSLRRARERGCRSSPIAVRPTSSGPAAGSTPSSCTWPGTSPSC